MEALGAAASCVALLEVSFKALSFLHELSEVQEDFRNLKQQVTNIDAIIKDLRTIPSLFSTNSGLPQLSEPTSIANAARQLQEIKDELDGIVAYCAKLPNDSLSRARKIKWIRQRNRITKLYEKARDAKSDLLCAQQYQQSSLMALHIVRQENHTSKIRSEIATFAQFMQFIQHNSLLAIQQIPLEDSAAGAVLSETQPQEATTVGGYGSISCSKDAIRQEENLTDSSNLDSAGNEESTSSRKQTQIIVSSLDLRIRKPVGSRACRCMCHYRGQNTKMAYKGRGWLQPLFGRWVIDHTPRLGCSEPTCKFVRDGIVYMSYQLPLWLCARSFLFKAAYGSYGLNLAIRPVRILAGHDNVWHWMEKTNFSAQDYKAESLAYYPDDQNESGQGLIEYAVGRHAYDFIEIFLERWVSLLPKQKLSRRVANHAYWILDLGNQLSDRETNILRSVISFADDVPDWETTKVHQAAWQGQGITEALQEEPWAIDELDRTGDSPLHLACGFGNSGAVEELIRAEADVNMLDAEGLTPLIRAAASNHVECMRLLLAAHCAIELQDRHGMRAMHHAAMLCCPEAFQLLLAAGASASARDWAGRTPLHLPDPTYSSSNPSDVEDTVKGTINLLLVAKDVDLEARDIDGRTPAMFALDQNRVPVLGCLVDAGASLHSIDNNSNNPLHLAAAYANIDTLEYLLSLDSELFLGLDTDHPNNSGLTSWDFFQLFRQAIPSQLGLARYPSSAEQCAFTKLYQSIRDGNLRHVIKILNDTIGFLHENNPQDARAALALLVDQYTEWNQPKVVAWYQGFDSKVKVGEFEPVIDALTEDISDRTAEIGTLPATRWDPPLTSAPELVDECETDDEWETCSSDDEDESLGESIDDASTASGS
ncbi:ankyrin repeat-containing domain protein [Mariannaea sp. PMI_226]|nr:ankyrin repeat-containing domain protein [Mariannaea sp. PMI_226]